MTNAHRVINEENLSLTDILAHCGVERRDTLESDDLDEAASKKFLQRSRYYFVQTQTKSSPLVPCEEAPQLGSMMEIKILEVLFKGEMCDLVYIREIKNECLG